MQGGFDIQRLRQEAHNRWLKPSEVFFILQNHEKYEICQELPDRPPSGTLLLFNRRVLRYFRKDGHVWRKKRNGKTVGEAHERLKVGNVDALHCYYAHGEQNPYFQRRCYWMLDPAYEHIVLVHYREVSEGRCIPAQNISLASYSSFNQSASFDNTQKQGLTTGSSEVCGPHEHSFSPGSVEEVSSKPSMGNIKTDCLYLGDCSGNSTESSKKDVKLAIRKLKMQLSLGDDDDDDDDDDDMGDDGPINNEQSFLPYSDRRLQDSGFLDYEIDTFELHELEGQPNDQYQEEDAVKQYDFGRNLTELSGDNSEQSLQLLDSDYMLDRRVSASWKYMLESNSHSNGVDACGTNSESLTLGANPQPAGANAHTDGNGLPAELVNCHESDIPLSSSENGNIVLLPYTELENRRIQYADCLVNGSEDRTSNHQHSANNLEAHLSETTRFLFDEYIESPVSEAMLPQRIEETIKCIPCDSSSEPKPVMGVLSEETGIHWNGAMNLSDDGKAFSSDYLLSNQNQHVPTLEADFSLSVTDIQLFSIREISPEWAFCSGNTKVIITGDFLSVPSECSWAVMFGDTEVPLEIIQAGVLCCQAPEHAPGKVTFCITSGNREACSEVREFEYLEKPVTSISRSNLPQTSGNKSTYELLLLVKFAQILLCGSDCPLQHEESTVESKIDPSGKLKRGHDQWEKVIETLLVGNENPSDTIDWLLQELLKDKLQYLLSSRPQKDEVTGCSLSKQEQCMIHMISGLGYEWALNPLLNSGVGINFRDVNGWTALHLAARFGREKMVAALLSAGASAGAVTDPTPKDPVGKTPASICASSGHKGLAGYLSEVALTTHLSSLTTGESEISLSSAAVEAEKAVESISEKTIQINAGETEDQLSFKDSLAAVRNTAQAAARIQSAFRAHSFRKRQQKAAADHVEYDLTPEDIHGLSVVSRNQRGAYGARDQKLHGAALYIQKKFRGWKGHKNFQTLRQHVVKIQAHVRGHQVRKKFKEFLWTVGVVEKVILRWRRRGVGLRGFHVEADNMDEIEEDDIVKVFRKKKVDAALDEAVSRVLSMVKSPNARQQYQRMLDSYRQAKTKLCNAGEGTSNTEIGDEDMFQLTLDESWVNLDWQSVD